MKKLKLEDVLSEISKNVNIMEQGDEIKCLPEFLPNTILPPVRRIVAIGDIHGDLKLALQSLAIARVIPYNEKYFTEDTPSQYFYNRLNTIKWVGEDTHIVQVGDQIDRCRPYFRGQKCADEGVTIDDEPSDIIILDFFTYLHTQAVVHGGAVISLLGNHEIMNLSGKLQYVSKLGIEQFGSLVDNKGDKFSSALHARGEFFKRGGPYAKFIACSRQSVVVIGSNLFAHAGVIERFIREIHKDPHLDPYKFLNSINNDVRRWILNMITPQNISYIVNSGDSLFWNRILGTIPEDTDSGSKDFEDSCSKHLEGALQLLGLNRMIIGHTPFIQQGISPACKNKLYRVDIGASRAFKPFNGMKARAPEVLEILEDKRINVLSA